MTLLRDVLFELIGMFISDAMLSLAVVVLIAAVAGLIGTAAVTPLAAGAVLLAGCLAILASSTLRAAARKARERRD